MSNFHFLNVQNIKKETPDCISIFFDVPENLKEEYDYMAGQYLTIKASIDGKDVRRAYSIFTPVGSDIIGVSVKKIEGGLMSTYLHNQITIGDRLEVMTPQGNFTITPDENSTREHYFFAAGSGITPIMSMISTLLNHEPRSTLYLLYGNRDEENIIYKNELERLQREYSGQFNMEISLSQPKKNKSRGFLGVLGNKKIEWKGWTGRIQSAHVAKFLQEYEPRCQNQAYYICGPGNMIDEVKTTLLGHGITYDHIHVEHFDTKTTPPQGKNNHTKGISSKLKAHLDGKEILINVKNDETILDALLDAGHDVPYSCSGGSCSTCMARIVGGSAKMDICHALTKKDLAQGYILTCQAHPTTNEIEIVFED